MKHKGYDVFLLRDVIADWRESYPLLAEIGDRTTELESLVVDLGKRLDVDGVVVLKGVDPRMWDSPYHLFLNFLFLNGPLFYNIAAPNAKAWIFETIHGELVWSHEYSSFLDKDGGPVSRSDFVNLSRNIDNAVPAYLIEQ